MKIRALKDMPFAKKGDEFQLTDNGGLVIYGSICKKSPDGFISIESGDLLEMAIEGWFCFSREECQCKKYKVGDRVSCKFENGFAYCDICGERIDLSPCKEDISLSEKFMQHIDYKRGGDCDDLATIAREHALKIIDEYVQSGNPIYYPGIRKALEEKMR